MSDFKEIKTQEEFDERIKERIERVEKKYEGYVSQEDLEKKINELNAQFEAKENELKEAYKDYISQDTFNSKLEEQTKDLNSKIATYESDSVKMKVAYKEGLPFEMIDRVRGNTEEEIIADIQSLKSFIGGGHKAPSVHTDPNLSAEDIRQQNEYANLLQISKELSES